MDLWLRAYMDGLVYIKAWINPLHDCSIYARERIDRSLALKGMHSHGYVYIIYIWMHWSIALHQGRACIAMGKCVHGLIYYYIYIYMWTVALHWRGCIAMDTCDHGLIDYYTYDRIHVRTWIDWLIYARERIDRLHCMKGRQCPWYHWYVRTWIDWLIYIREKIGLCVRAYMDLLIECIAWRGCIAMVTCVYGWIDIYKSMDQSIAWLFSICTWKDRSIACIEGDE